MGTGIEVEPCFNIQVKLDKDDPDYAIFEVYMKDGTWLGLVLGDSGMAFGADMIQIKADGINSRVYDKFSQGYISPPQDTEKNLLDNKFRFFDGDWVRFTLRRALDTGDRRDFVLPVDSEFDLGWAVHSETNDLLAQHNKAGALRAIIKEDGTEAFERQLQIAGGIALSLGGLALASLAATF